MLICCNKLSACFFHYFYPQITQIFTDRPSARTKKMLNHERHGLHERCHIILPPRHKGTKRLSPECGVVELRRSSCTQIQPYARTRCSLGGKHRLPKRRTPQDSQSKGLARAAWHNGDHRKSRPSTNTVPGLGVFVS